MSKVIWTFQAFFYDLLRKNAISSRILRKENDAILSMLQMLPENCWRAVLDLGSGSGNSLSLLPSKTGFIVAVDYSYRMLKRSRVFFPNVLYLNGEAVALPLKHNIFDLVVSVGLLEYLPDADAFFSEIFTKLKSDGYLVFTISPPRLVAGPRTLLGHKIYTHREIIIEEKIGRHSFVLVNQRKTLLQQQYVIQKSVNGNSTEQIDIPDK